MSLDLYRRHASDCKYAKKGQNYTKCSCPIWCYGTLRSRPVRKSLKTRDWTLALRAISRMEEDQDNSSHPAFTIFQALKEYLSDCEARKLAQSTIVSRRNVLNPFSEFCAGRNLREIGGVRLDEFRKFRESRRVASTTQRKEIEYLRAFCDFCIRHKWMSENYAKHLKPPRDDEPVTMPYEPDEIQKMLEACDRIKNFYAESSNRAKQRARALLLLLLYSGLRISDAVQLERDRVKDDGRIRMYAQKSKVPLYIRLHPACVKALRDLPVESPYFLEWQGKAYDGNWKRQTNHRVHKSHFRSEGPTPSISRYIRG
jgi:integrase